jgi:hypothetical protein
MAKRWLAGEMAQRLAGYWRQGSAAQRWLFAVGSVLMLAGVAHLVPAAASDLPWVGPVSFRKPTLFGVSFGLTCVTIAWMLAYVRVGRRGQVAVAALLGGGSLVEVAAVSLQAFRGVPSHFNVITGAFNAAVFGVMGVAVIAIVAAIVLVAVWSFTRLEAPAPLARGMRAGLVLLLVSQALGAHMIEHGLDQVIAQGQIAAGGKAAPNVFGAAGQLKVPHAVTIHAAQVLPGIAWLLGFTGWPSRRSQRLTTLAVAGYGGLVAVAALQTFSGRAPVDLLPLSGAVLVAAIALLAGVAVTTVVGLATRARPGAAPVIAGDATAGEG